MRDINTAQVFARDNMALSLAENYLSSWLRGFLNSYVALFWLVDLFQLILITNT